MALNIRRKENGIDLSSNELYIEDSKEKPDIVSTTRINIDYSEEARFFPWRFYMKDNPYISTK